MAWRNIFSISAIAAVGLVGLSAVSHAQTAQQAPAARPAQPAQPAPPKGLKDQLVGSWTILIADDVHADGTQTPQFGPNPIGTAIFAADGHYSLQIMRSARPKFASNVRVTGTADENKAAVQGMISHFGTYAVNEADKSLTFRIEGSSFPNWDGTQQKRTITSLTAGDELTWNNPAPSTGAMQAVLAWKWVK
jgi:hypothetical protein